MLRFRCGRAATAALLLLASLLALAASAPAAVVPSGFRDDVVLTELSEPTALRFAPDGRVFVAEKSGRILVFDDVDDTSPTVFADLRTDVYDPADRGLLGLEIDPQFPARPYVYALYTYDHLLGDPAPAPKWGEPDQSGDACDEKPPSETEVDECPVSGRLVRLSAGEGGAGDHAVTDGLGKALQKVLVEDWCQQYSSHSVGDLRFGPGGALYASGGDGASFYDPDYGQFGWPQKNVCGDPPGGVGTALTPPSAEGGALRAQDARTHGDPTGLDGTMIRIDPDTGAGLAGNPMAGSGDANERRIVAFGFRNPFRFAIDPATGEIYTGNVGWNTYEEIDRFPSVPATAYNSGWPCYEGPGPQPSYQALELNLCKGLYAETGPAEPSLPFFLYRHGESVIPGDGCSSNLGAAISGLTVYRGDQFPAAYDGALFFADPVRGCIYVMPPDDGRPDPLATETFMSSGGLYPGVDLEVGPDGALYYVKLFGSEEGGTIHRISYDPHAPVARLAADKRWGDAPLQVQFDAGASTDPDGDSLTYRWDLDGDGKFEAAATGPKRTTTFNGDENVEVSVLVGDGGKSNVARLTIYPDDTPPEPAIEQPSPQLLWGVGQGIDFAGHAADAEEPGDEVPADGLYWKLRLYHCPDACHAHPRQVFPATDSGSFIAPDHDYPSHLELSLTATDERGLGTTTAVEIYPRTVDLQIESNPPGLTVGAGLFSQPTPYSVRAIEGSHLTLTAPPNALVGGALVPWTSWSDGGDRVHTIVAADSDTYRATYKGTEVVGPKPSGPPQTRLFKRPKRRSIATTAAFTFAADIRGARFQCRLDAGLYRGCRSPRVYRHLKPGRHVFRVRAIAGGVVEPTPVVFRWRVAAPVPGRGATRPR